MMSAGGRQIWAAALLAAHAMLTACAPQPSAQPLQVQQAERPALWQLEKAGRRVWLFGSIHILPQDYEWRSSLLNSALQGASTLVLEAQAAGDQQAASALFAQMAFADGRPPLADRVKPAQRKALDRAIVASGLDRTLANRLKSWAAAIAFAPRTNAAAGSASNGIDAALRRQFEAEAKPVVGLETASEQLSLFDRLPEAEQRKMLAAVLHGGAGGDADAIVEAWKRGDADAALAASRQSFMALPSLNKLLLEDRNRRWAAQIELLATKDQAVFVAVGIAHLGGKVSLVAQLRQLGFRISKVQ